MASFLYSMWCSLLGKFREGTMGWFANRIKCVNHVKGMDDVMSRFGAVNNLPCL